jgi:hypothetical protein
MNNSIKDDIAKDIRNIEIVDAYEFVSGNKVIANIVITVKNVIKNYKLVRTSKGKYMMQ